MDAECRAYFEKVSEYLDGELDPEICRRIEAHLQDCPECRQCIESLRRTIQLCRHSGTEPVPPELSRRLRAALEECLQSRRS